MSGDEFTRFLEGDDDLPEPGPEHADTLYRDQYDVVWHCLPIEGLGWTWQAVGGRP